MKFCIDHWDRLRAAIAERGLSHLIHVDRENLLVTLQSQIEKGPAQQPFDPLLGATWAIYSSYLRSHGLCAFVGDRCPLCEVAPTHENIEANWINGASDDQLKRARALGLAPEAA